MIDKFYRVFQKFPLVWLCGAPPPRKYQLQSWRVKYWQNVGTYKFGSSHARMDGLRWMSKGDEEERGGGEGRGWRKVAGGGGGEERRRRKRKERGRRGKRKQGGGRGRERKVAGGGGGKGR